MNESIYKSVLFNGIDNSETDMILKCLNTYRKRYKKGDCVISAQEKTEAIGIVGEGKMQIVKEDFCGNRTIISDLLPGDTFAEASGCPAKEPVPFSVIAITDSAAVFLDQKELFCAGKLPCSCHNRLLYNLTRSLAMKNNELSRKISHLTERTTRDKLISYLSEQAHSAGKNSFTIPFNRQELADYLSVDRSAMSNELSKMRREGIIDFYKNSFRFL